MLINFNEIKDTVFENFKGGQGLFTPKIFDDGKCKIMRGRLAPHSHLGLHVHEGNSEMIYVLSGTGKILYEGEYLPLKSGDCHYCPMGHAHSLINDGEVDLVVLNRETGEIYGRVFKDSARAKILASEYGAFGLPPDILDPVYGLLRNDEVARNHYWQRVKSHCMGYGTYSGSVVAKLCKICVAHKFILSATAAVLVCTACQ